MLLNQHLSNIQRNYTNLIDLGSFLDNDDLLNFKDFMNIRYQTYLESFKEIFEPNKKINNDMVYFTDVRSLAKYNEDIVSGWLVEDFFSFILKLNIFKEHNFTFEIINHDADRKIKKERTYINSDPDFIIYHKNLDFKLEIQALLIPYDKFHIKNNKALRLLSMTSFLYCLLLTKKEIIFFYPDDIMTLGSFTHIQAFGGKEGYEFKTKELPKNKRIHNNFLNKILITLYWFYWYKKLGKENFYIFQKKVITESKTIYDLLSNLDKEITL